MRERVLSKRRPSATSSIAAQQRGPTTPWCSPTLERPIRSSRRRPTTGARAFLGLGVGPGDKVGIRMEQEVDYYAVLVGAAKVGAVGVPVNVRFKAYELRHVITNSDMVVLVGSPDGGESR